MLDMFVIIISCSVSHFYLLIIFDPPNLLNVPRVHFDQRIGLGWIVDFACPNSSLELSLHNGQLRTYYKYRPGSVRTHFFYDFILSRVNVLINWELTMFL